MASRAPQICACVLAVLLTISIIIIIYLGVRVARQTPHSPHSGSQEPPQEVDYYGFPLGRLSELAHGVSGRVFIVDEKRILVKNLTYDGTAPQAFFWIGLKNKSNDSPDTTGQPTPDENGSKERLRRSYKSEDVLLTLESNITVRDLKWFSLWCVEYRMNFGHVLIPQKLDVPAPMSLGEFFVSSLTVSSGQVIALDHLTVRVERFNFEGRVEDVFFFAGLGSNPGTASYLQKIPRLDGGLTPLDHKELTGDNITVTLQLPSPLSLIDSHFIAIYSESTPLSYGMINLPRFVNVPPKLNP